MLINAFKTVTIDQCYLRAIVCRSLYLLSSRMANSKFSYVRSFELDDRLAPQQWIVISVKNGTPSKTLDCFLDCRKSRQNYGTLMTRAALEVMDQFRDVKLAYNHFEYVHFVLGKDCTVYHRRCNKLMSYLTSCMSSSFVRSWSECFGECSTMQELPVFVASVHLLPNDQLLRDFLTMHQMSHHYVNLKQTVRLGIMDGPPLLANEILSVADIPEDGSEAYYNDLLFDNFGIVYNNEPEMFKKGTILIRQKQITEALTKDGNDLSKTTSQVSICTADLKKNNFWLENDILENTSLNVKFNDIPKFRVDQKLLPHSWLVIRIDGKDFHKLSTVHNFDKPNDLRAINLMNVAAAEVMNLIPEIVMSFGESDEYSFVVDRYSTQARHHSVTIVSQCVSIFTSSYVSNWNKLFDEKPLQFNPVFDGRAVQYPTNTTLRDYLSWRQADCHINNMYNTAFWKLIQLTGCSNREAEQKLRGTFSADKRRFMLKLGVDYDKEPVIHRKGSFLYRVSEGVPPVICLENTKANKISAEVEMAKGKRYGQSNESNLWWDADCDAAKAHRLRMKKLCQLEPNDENLEELRKSEVDAKKVFKAAKYKFKQAADGAVHYLNGNSAHVPEKCPNISLCPELLEKLSGSTGLEKDESVIEKRGNAWWNLDCHNAKILKSNARKMLSKDHTATNEKLFREADAHMKLVIRLAKKSHVRLQREVIEVREETADKAGNLQDSKSSSAGVEEFEELPSSTANEKSPNGHHLYSGNETKLSLCSSNSSVSCLADGENSAIRKNADVIAFPSYDSSSSSNYYSMSTGDSKTLSTCDNGSSAGIVSNTLASEVANGTAVSNGAVVAPVKSASAIVAVKGGGKIVAPGIALCHADIISDRFWKMNPHFLGNEKSTLVFEDE